ncbi:OmpA family protein [Nitrosovibrio sp. Nv17]|uniref:OmpA family protein n=1 Tax=Nitrosovibrio sp. Nv17 TaxID=1855339 RepID=UPI000930913C|nr:OmpA family protein [Nitrosovibrio sp. Nv17]
MPLRKRHAGRPPLSRATCAAGRRQFPFNWELSVMRASSVVRLLIDHGLEATRLTALGHGEYHPLASNETVEGRMRNRRVTVLILPAPPDLAGD